MKDKPEFSELRQRAEKDLGIAAGSTEAFSEMSPEKTDSLIHELQVHQIELKVQNDELRSTQEDLEKARDRYSHLYDFAPVGYFALNQKGFIDEANLTFASMLSVDRSALIGQPFTRFILSDDQDIFYKHRRGLQETEAPQSFDLRLVKKSGHAFYARLECIVITNKGNDSKQIRVAVNDITERKEAEALRESEEKYRVLFEGSTHGILITDAVTGRFVDANLSICQMLGYSKTELLQLGIADIHPRDSLDLVISDIKFQDRGGKPVGRAIPCLRKDGTVFYADIVGAKTIVHGRRCNVGFFIDTTERKQAEEALQESEAKFRNLFQNHSAAKLIIDPDTGNIVEANRSAERFYGWSVKQLKEMRIQDINTLSGEQVKAEMEKARLLERTYFEFRHRLSDGSFKEVGVYSAKVDIKGKALLHSIIHDISERKRIEEQKDKLVSDLQKALSEVKTLRGFLPICMYCKQIRDDKGYWSKVESYIHKHSDAKFSHSICPECAKKNYPDMDLYGDEQPQE
jgi:PAS domain S-box-containing protein